jgi:hypothetical protein
MSNEDVSALAEQGIDFQLHTHRHRVPGERTAFLREITDNRNRIAALGGRGIAHFCYPSGVHEPQFLPWLTEAGVLTATTCESGIATRETARLLLPRIIDGMHLSPVEVEAWLTGVAAFVPGRPTWLGETASHAEDSPEP